MNGQVFDYHLQVAVYYYIVQADQIFVRLKQIEAGTLLFDDLQLPQVAERLSAGLQVI